ncbi:assimilatory sulfite reductase (NADPH) flavoprotein subunit [Enterovibrio paralichthyis]|uniref:assimilatory sulfite reductase (NADPH) flavoprotein subunit n=1 Tax=Enterovibrio paralichthyis TaxID=2853805 RepID=UPI001C45E753|nr:assimilatory sulfite reductase (NADPH) flavoprotein subunit [Enterovibrio paralichthyis]MBV7298903.1 assimilatory sulfite reductase (NADPH) flavoprotein subunit [Enterovibrio paralichthyis]
MLLKELSALASPLNDQQIGQLQKTVADLSPQQLAWISGYFWGLSQTPAAAGATPQPLAAAVATAAKPAGKLTIIYASQTGNAKGVAKSLEAAAQADGIEVSLYSADDYKPRDLAKETHLVIVASTNGEGEPPDNAISLHEFLQSKKAPKLDKLQYAVLGLGDSSYEFFCQTGKDFDTFLSKLGAKAITPRIDCDVDYEGDAERWRSDVLGKVKETIGGGASEVVVPLHAATSVGTASAYSKQNPYTAELVANQKITGRDSGKDVRHIEIDLGESGLTYQPGDALGVYYTNSPALADEILAKAGLTGDETVEVAGESLTLRQALIEKFEITASNPQQVAAFAELSGSKKLQKLAEDKDKLRQYANNTQVADVLGEKKTKLTAEQLVGLLRKLTPRLYSIASSQEEVGEEVHLTVGLVEFKNGDNTRVGGASGFLAQRAEESGEVKVFIEHNDNFKLPADDDAPVIMVGPGTGIAPFRAFLQERDARGAEGKNWLFFGDRTFTQDFLYQVEWQKYLKDGVLTEIDLAFSRDQAEKVYVQDKLLAKGQAVWQWLQDGAYLYICGDATRMAKDVHEALITVIEQHGGKSREDAENYLNELRKAKRYQKDVY